jgi:hypothetical protein
MSNLQMGTQKLKSLKKLALVGLGFAIVWTIIWGVFMYAVVDLIAKVILESFPFNFGSLILVLGITTSFVITVMLLIRTNRLRIAADKGDLIALKKLDSLLWGILAIFFLGIIGGYALIAVHRELPKISFEPPNHQKSLESN